MGGGKSSTAAAGDTAQAKTGFVNAHRGANNANAAPDSKCKASLTFTPNIGSKRFPRIHNADCEKKLEWVEITQKFHLQFAAEPKFMETLVRITSQLSAEHPQGTGFETVFTIRMEEYLDRHDPENRIKRRNERRKRSAERKKKHAEKGTGLDPEKSARAHGESQAGHSTDRR